MRKFRLIARVWIALLALAVAVMPVSGAHLHLCFDGSEPPATFHAIADAGAAAHNAPDSRVHHDSDISAQSAVLAKKADTGLDLPSLISVTWLSIRLPVEAPAPVVLRDLSPSVSLQVQHRLPPLRGPPV